MRPEDVTRHAEFLANRVRKNDRKLRKAFERESIDAYRLYDWDIPEVRAVVDRYADHLVVAEYERAQTRNVVGYLESLGAAAAEALGVDPANVHLKRRHTRPREGPRYAREGDRGARIEVRERSLRFLVNLDDYLDTGLFSDHRETRRMVAGWSDGARVLNLFGYTGTFTAWAAHGGARETVTVDLSSPYSTWAEDNLALNGLSGEQHRFVARDVHSYLASAPAPFDLVIVDPPSFSTLFGERDFDVLRDHADLLTSIRPLVRPGGRVLFSSNHQRFEPRLDVVPYERIEEITERTVPRDYRNRRIHRAFLLAT